jgi:hypothetical protein
VSISGRETRWRGKEKNRITDENVTGILAAGEKFTFVSQPSGKSKNWRKIRRKKMSPEQFLHAYSSYQARRSSLLN